MTLRIDAIYENGVFIPAQRPALADHERVHLTVESATKDPSEVHLVRDRRHARIQIDPTLARDIATSPEFDPNEG